MGFQRGGVLNCDIIGGGGVRGLIGLGLMEMMREGERGGGNVGCGIQVRVRVRGMGGKIGGR